MKIFKNIRLKFDRLFSKGPTQQILWLVVLMAVVYAILTCLSYVEFLYSPNPQEIPQWYDRYRDILMVLIDPGSYSNSMSSFFTILCAVIGLIIFSGMLITVMSNALERRVESYNHGETKYKVHNHVIILGFNKSVPSLLREISKHHKGHILLMCEKETTTVRDWVLAQLDCKIKEEKDIVKNLIILNGIRSADDDLERLCLNNHVKEIYVIGEEDETAHDSISMECVKKLSEKLQDKQKIKCHVQLDSDTMFTALQKVNMEYDDKLIFMPFNFNEIWAHKALATIPKDGYYKPLDGKGITRDSNQHVHLIIFGMNSLSWSLAVNAAHILHFPNYVEGNFSTCSKITFIDENAFVKGKTFRSRYHNLFNLARWREINDKQCNDLETGWIDPIGDTDSTSPYKHLGLVNFMDIQWEFIEGNIYDKYIMQYLETSASDENSITTIALCSEDSDKNNSICLSFSEAIRSGSNEILIRQDESELMVNDILLRAFGYKNIRAFGMMDECYTENLNSDKYGKLINACYKDISFDGSKEEVIQAIENEWKKIGPLERCSSNYCANMLFVKLRSLSLDMNNITENNINAALSKQDKNDDIQRTENNRWNTEKLLLGFRPLFADELDAWIHLEGSAKDNQKKQLKQELKHVDICSLKKLEEIDSLVLGNNAKVNSKLWTIYNLIMHSDE